MKQDGELDPYETRCEGVALNYVRSRNDPVAVSFDHGNKLLGSIKAWLFND
jgi:hypothetical protein